MYKKSVENQCASNCQEFLDLTEVMSLNPTLTVSLASPGEFYAVVLCTAVLCTQHRCF